MILHEDTISGRRGRASLPLALASAMFVLSLPWPCGAAGGSQGRARLTKLRQVWNCRCAFAIRGG